MSVTYSRRLDVYYNTRHLSLVWHSNTQDYYIHLYTHTCNTHVQGQVIWQFLIRSGDALPCWSHKYQGCKSTYKHTVFVHRCEVFFAHDVMS